MPTGHVKSSLPDYATGRLDADLRSGVEEHLRSCPSCRQDYEEMQGVVRALRENRGASPAAFYFSSFLPRVRDRLGWQEKSSWMENPLLVRLVGPLTAAALMVILIIELPFNGPHSEVGDGGELAGMVGSLSGDEITQVLIEHGNRQLFVSPDQEITVSQAVIDRILSEELSLASGSMDPSPAPFIMGGGVSSESLNLLSDTQIDFLLQQLEERSTL